MSALTTEEFSVYAKLIIDLTGIDLDSKKGYLIEMRLDPLVRELGLTGYSDLYYRIRNDSSGALARKVIDRITTQETSFFRDRSPFEMLKFKILPELIDSRRGSFPAGSRIPLRIWSAAGSTGQEAYSILIAVKEALGDLSGFSVSLLVTDISDSAIAYASRGIYQPGEIDRGMSPELLSRYFLPAAGGFRVRDDIRSLATFKRWNLLDDFSRFGPFDVIFCRNVAIYFAEPEKRRLFDRLERVLADDGSLVVGSTESLLGTGRSLEARRYHHSVYYRRPDKAVSV